MVEHALEQRCIDYVRIDGNVPSGACRRVLERYRNDSNVKVMLITTTCGALGQVDLPLVLYFFLTVMKYRPDNCYPCIHVRAITEPYG